MPRVYATCASGAEKRKRKREFEVAAKLSGNMDNWLSKKVAYLQKVSPVFKNGTSTKSINDNSPDSEILRVVNSSSLVEQNITSGSEGSANDSLFLVDVVEQHLLSDDPGQWQNLSTIDKDYLIEKGPVGVSKYFNYPVNSQTQKKFNNNLMYRCLNNGEKIFVVG